MRQAAWRTIAVSILIVVVAGAASAQAAAPQIIKVTLKEFSFTPKNLTLAAGPARFVLTNAGAIEHDFMIDALSMDSGMVKPGTTVTIPPANKPPLMLKKGTYQAYCMVPGHKELGMVMTVVVK